MVCLAMSRKNNGLCVAGKVYEKSSFTHWVRPINPYPNTELMKYQVRRFFFLKTRLLDIVTIKCTEHKPFKCQTENHIVDKNTTWKKLGTITFDDLGSALDHHHPTLWINGHNSAYGCNDRFPENNTIECSNSLRLIKPENLKIRLAIEKSEFRQQNRKKVRAIFDYQGVNYCLSVTDPIIERFYQDKETGIYYLPTSYLCISVGETYQNYRYKLVASLITAKGLQ